MEKKRPKIIKNDKYYWVENGTSYFPLRTVTEIFFNDDVATCEKEQK